MEGGGRAGWRETGKEEVGSGIHKVARRGEIGKKYATRERAGRQQRRGELGLKGMRRQVLEPLPSPLPSQAFWGDAVKPEYEPWLHRVYQNGTIRYKNAVVLYL